MKREIRLDGPIPGGLDGPACRRAGSVARQVEIVRPGDGARYLSITLALDGDGGLTLRSHEMGAGPHDAWLDDQEVTLSIPATHVGLLALVLTRGLIEGRKDAMGRLAALCEEHDIDHTLAGWS